MQQLKEEAPRKCAQAGEGEHCYAQGQLLSLQEETRGQ